MSTTPDTHTTIPIQTIVRDRFSSRFKDLTAAISVKWALYLLDCVLAVAMDMAIKHGRETDTRITALEIEIESLRARCAELEARPGLADANKGVWQQSTKYNVGELVTHSGSSWVARVASVSRRPGGPDGVWQLVVKRGADGKDGRDCSCPHCRGEAPEAEAVS